MYAAVREEITAFGEPSVTSDLLRTVATYSKKTG
jgi:hypothetical protein